ncbi:hypothetical protein FN976_17495 [Caenimonas sedimenti]|uniref:Uncharacterized protein n=1 Tax=Caenimonas sedimenti TaxID=2596921 RepID=A0A562ZNH4_9BURK|nr:hypothetical protein [Caenimonas sedimenti]TWO70129.1 hypothetical protein FN976_17495 [Caenimonas sedimenti]
MLAALDKHEAEITAVIDHWWDAAEYSQVSATADELRAYASALPHCAVASLSVLISHTELLQRAWLAAKCGMAVAGNPEVRSLLEEHLRGVGLLKAKLCHPVRIDSHG